MLDLIDKLLITAGKLPYKLILFLFWSVIQVYLGNDGQVQVYANATIQPGSPINSDLLLDQSEANIYVMTRNTVCILNSNLQLLYVSKYGPDSHNTNIK